MKFSYFFAFLLINLNITFHVNAQVTLKGKILNHTSKVPIYDATLTISHNNLQKQTNTNQNGEFIFKKIDQLKFKLSCSFLGYEDFSKEYSFTDKDRTDTITITILLIEKIQLLKEITVKQQLNQMVVKQDTIEFNAAAFNTTQNARLAELIKQLPGLSFSTKGEAFFMGKVITKLRVNGQDFFTGNLKELINQLPAGIISKVQIIEDYGDEARLTGNKDAKPKQIMNVVTKANINKGKFADVKAEGGSNDQFGFSGNYKYWKQDRQFGMGLTQNQQFNGFGNAKQLNGMVSYNDALTKTIKLSSSYKIGDMLNENSIEKISEQTLSQGLINSNSISNNFTKNIQHTVSADLSNITNQKVEKLSMSYDFSIANSLVESNINQSGLINQQLTQLNSSSNQNNSFSANYANTLKLKKLGRSFSFKLKMDYSIPNSKQTQFLNIYNNTAITDSTFNLIANTRNKRTQYTAGFNFRENLKIFKNIKYKSTFNFNHNNTLIHYNNNYLGEGNYIGLLANDKILQNLTQANFFTHDFKAMINLNTPKKFRYGLGIYATLTHSKAEIDQSSTFTNKVKLNLMPQFSFGFTKNKGNLLVSTYPILSQPSLDFLIPVPNFNQAENIKIGNPNLEPELRQIISIIYTNIIFKRMLLKIDLQPQFIRDRTVSNTHLLSNTRIPVIQEISYLNLKRDFLTTNIISLAKILKNNHYDLSYNFFLTTYRNIFFIDNVQVKNPTTRISQNASFSYRIKNFNTTSELNYGFENTKSTQQNFESKVTLLSVNNNTEFIIKEKSQLGLSASLTKNWGYKIVTKNVILLNPYVQHSIYQGKIQLRFVVNDLLNTGLNQRSVTDINTISDIRGNQIKRYYYVSAKLNIDKF